MHGCTRQVRKRRKHHMRLLRSRHRGGIFVSCRGPITPFLTNQAKRRGKYVVIGNCRSPFRRFPGATHTCQNKTEPPQLFLASFIPFHHSHTTQAYLPLECLGNFQALCWLHSACWFTFALMPRDSWEWTLEANTRASISATPSPITRKRMATHLPHHPSYPWLLLRADAKLPRIRH